MTEPDAPVIELEGPFEHRAGVGWIARLTTDGAGATEAERRAWILREDGRALGPGAAMEAEVCALGAGRFAIWPRAVCFSASDSSDPNTNGHAYRLARRTPVARPFSHEISDDGTPTAWVAPEALLRCAVIGVGARGARFAEQLSALEGVSVAWLVDVADERLRACAAALPDGEVRLAPDAAPALADPEVGAVFITAPDPLHAELAQAAFAAGKHVFLEKPLATTLGDATAIVDAWRKSGRILQLGYILREAPFYRAARQVIAEGRLGRVHTLHLTDYLGVEHGASYMRRWHRHSASSGGLMVHKGCHDLDLACWLLDTQPRAVASFGGNEAFTRAPPAPFCSQCPDRPICPYEDRGLYEARTAAQRAHPTAFGLDICVFTADKDIVDTQIVAFELASGARGAFGLAMHNPVGSQRTLTVLGQDGRLDGEYDAGRFEVTTNDGAPPISWKLENAPATGHQGADDRALRAFLEACLGRRAPQVQAPADALRGLVFALAAEQARKTGAVVRVNEDLSGFDGAP